MSNFDGNIVAPSAWPDVPQLSAACQALGGPGAPMNAQAVAIVARLGFLADAVAALDAGAALFTGSGAPANTLGKNSDVYIDTTGGALYGPKAAGVWPTAVSLKGPPGVQGDPGAGGAVGPAGGFTHPVPFNAAGTTTWVVPDGVTQLVLEMWGGGGGGGRVSAADTNSNFFKGAGGAGGSYIKSLVSVTPGQVLTLGIGAGGIGAGQVGNTSSDSGTKGGDSTISVAGGAWTVTAGGGGGASGNASGGSGVAGRTGTATVIESINGQQGQSALIVSASSGAAAPYYSGSGGDGARGGAGGFGVHSYPNSAGDLATPGTFPGGAGAGADEQGYGGNGAGGKAIVWY